MEGLILENDPGDSADVTGPLVRPTTLEAIRSAHARKRPLWVENRMNATVERLTLLSTVVPPLNLIASFYGMNFVHTPEFGWGQGRAVVVGVMFLTTGAIWTYFKGKRRA